MANGIDTEVPPWLQRNWQPRDTFDPSPWLAERYRRQVAAEEIPLRLQSMVLQNQQTQLAIQQQAMAAELQGIQLQQYQSELPQLNAAAKLAATDPNGFRNRPLTFRNPQLQKQYLDLRKMVAESDYALAADKKITEDTELASTIAKETGFIVKRDQHGMIDPQSLAMGAEALALQREKNFNAMHTGPVDRVGMAYKVLQEAEASGNKEMADLRRAELAKLTQASGMSITTNPDGTMTFIQGPGAGALTKTNQSKVQASLLDTLEVLDTGKQLLPKLNEHTVGLQAAAENIVMDKLLAQKFPELANKDRASAVVLANSLRGKVVRMNKSDGNISEPERKEILKAFPQINDPIDSAANAKQMVETALEMAAAHAVRDAIALKVPIPVEVAQSLSDATIARLYKAGLLTTDQAIAIGKLKRGIK